MAGGAAEVRVDELSAGGEPRRPRREGGRFAVVIVGSQRAELQVRGERDPAPAKHKGGKKADEEEETVFHHDAWASIVEG